MTNDKSNKAMNIEIHSLGARLDSFNYQEAQDALLAIIEKGSNAILDMTACNYVSSTGLRVLLSSKKMAEAKGLQLYLVGFSDEVRDIMEVTGFDNFFESFATVDECLKALAI
ncbi:MAG: STAS domain-containing protein [Prevotella sp.]|jgi:anti-sigma B factor antagonist|nr:STAS domain-containing protein [Prevotella sp.]